MFEKYQFLRHLPGLANVKDINSRFIIFTEELAKLAGWSSADAMHGKNDFDTPCDLAKFADQFIQMDKKVIVNETKMIALDIQRYNTGWGMILAEKIPLVDETGKTIGIYSSLIDLSETNLFRFYLNIYENDSKFTGEEKKPVSYILNEAHCPLPLTEKQENCLFLLIRGKTIKEAAKILDISPRTVECHIDAIKIKLGCQYKSEVIEKAIEKGFLFYIPKLYQRNKA